MVFCNHVTGRLSDFLPAGGLKASVLAPFLVPMGFPWVWLFLVLSGFLLTKSFATHRFSLDGGGIKRFWLTRMYRLLPLMWAVGLLWFALAAAGMWSQALPTPSLGREFGIALSLPWVPYFHRTFAIGSANSPVWSAVIEVHFSIILPLLLGLFGLSARRFAWIAVVWVAGLVVLLYVAILTEGDLIIFPFIYGGHLYNLGFFLAGGILAMMRPIGGIKAMPWPAIVLVATLALGFVQYQSFLDLNSTLAWSPLLMLPIWFVVVAKCDDSYQAKLPSTWQELLRRKRWGLCAMLETGGILSYSLYLAHKPISFILIDQLQLANWVVNEAALLVLTLACLLISLPIYAGLYIGIERRFRLKSPAPTLQLGT